MRHSSSRVHALRQCRREIAELPGSIRSDLADALARLGEGLSLSMPLSRPMPAIAKRAHELRLRDRSGDYRVVYVITATGQIVLVVAFKKASRATPDRMIALARERIRERP